VTERKRYDSIREQTSQPRFGLVHAFYANMGGFAFYGPYGDNNPIVEESLFQISTNPLYTVEVPRFRTLIYIIEHFPHVLTDITEEYILDKAEYSSLSKALLIVQVAWFCTNCASRLSHSLPLSLLEVSTAAHASRTLFTYFVWYSKPLNVAAPTIMREKEAREVYALLKCSQFEYNEALEMAKERAAADSSAPTGPQESAIIVLAANVLQHHLSDPIRPPHESCFRRPKKLLFPGSFGNKANKAKAMAMSMVLPTILYGIVHFLAWSVQFPTALERSLWRASSFVVTCSGLVALLLLWSLLWLDEVLKSNYGLTTRLDVIATTMFIGVIPLVHTVASGFLVVESFRQLYFLDPAVYQLPL